MAWRPAAATSTGCWAPPVSLTAFLAGSAVGAFLLGGRQRSSLRGLAPALALEWALLASFALCWQAVGDPAADNGGRLALIALGASAMGIQGASVFALRIPGVLTNAMTATLMLGGVVLGLRARGESTSRGPSKLSGALLGVLCGSYVASAVVVAAVGRPELTSAVPAAGLGLVLIALLVRQTVPRRAATAR